MSRGLPGDHTIASCFPARAGMSRGYEYYTREVASFPRPRGDEPTNQYLWNLVDEFSSPTWG